MVKMQIVHTPKFGGNNEKLVKIPLKKRTKVKVKIIKNTSLIDTTNQVNLKVKKSKPVKFVQLIKNLQNEQIEHAVNSIKPTNISDLNQLSRDELIKLLSNTIVTNPFADNKPYRINFVNTHTENKMPEIENKNPENNEIENKNPEIMPMLEKIPQNPAVEQKETKIVYPTLWSKMSNGTFYNENADESNADIKLHLDKFITGLNPNEVITKINQISKELSDSYDTYLSKVNSLNEISEKLTQEYEKNMIAKDSKKKRGSKKRSSELDDESKSYNQKQKNITKEKTILTKEFKKKYKPVFLALKSIELNRNAASELRKYFNDVGYDFPIMSYNGDYGSGVSKNNEVLDSSRTNRINFVNTHTNKKKRTKPNRMNFVNTHLDKQASINVQIKDLENELETKRRLFSDKGVSYQDRIKYIKQFNAIQKKLDVLNVKLSLLKATEVTVMNDS